MPNEGWLTWGLPAVILCIGAISFAVVWLGSRDFDRRYPDSPK